MSDQFYIAIENAIKEYRKKDAELRAVKIAACEGYYSIDGRSTMDCTDRSNVSTPNTGSMSPLRESRANATANTRFLSACLNVLPNVTFIRLLDLVRNSSIKDKSEVYHEAKALLLPNHPSILASFTALAHL